MLATLPRPKPLLSLLVVLGVSIAILWAMGRPPICTCGTVTIWGQVGPAQSQMLADWYSPSHIVHGFLFYWALSWLWPRASVELRFLVALIVEAAWEIVENTPMIIDRYREATIALGYSGDSILNSASDIAMMALGFLAARRLPVWASVGGRAAARACPARRHPRQSDAQRVDAAGAERRDPQLAGGGLELQQGGEILLADRSREPGDGTKRRAGAAGFERAVGGGGVSQHLGHLGLVSRIKVCARCQHFEHRLVLRQRPRRWQQVDAPPGKIELRARFRFDP